MIENSYLTELESEAIYVLREAYAQFQNPVILFSGGKDSIVLVHLAYKAFYPSNIPFKLLHIDTGHNFQEALDFRDKLVEKYGLNLIIGSVQDSIDRKLVDDPIHDYSYSRNKIQSITLFDTIENFKIDCAIGGGRRDEEKARAKERFFSHRDCFGAWDPKNQRPELWNIYNAHMNIGEHFRVFPISNWTELDVWNYILKENIELPSLYFSHKRMVFERDGQLLAAEPNIIKRRNSEIPVLKQVRCRTVGDVTCTGLIESTALTLNDIVNEIAITRTTERGGRMDDKFSETAMEDRKKEGYF